MGGSISAIGFGALAIFSLFSFLGCFLGGHAFDVTGTFTFVVFVSNAAVIECAEVGNFTKALVPFALPAARIPNAPADGALVLVNGLLRIFNFGCCVKREIWRGKW